MSSLPDQSLDEILAVHESLSWRFPNKLGCVVVESLDELNKRLQDQPENDSVNKYSNAFFSEHKLGAIYPGFDIYSRKIEESRFKACIDMIFPVAYGCGQCKKIVIGPPRIKAKQKGSEEHRGQHGLSYYCVNCNKQIFDITYGWTFKFFLQKLEMLYAPAFGFSVLLSSFLQAILSLALQKLSIDKNVYLNF